MKPVILFIGRFQPLHNGHLTILKKLAKKAKLIKLGIGSSQHKNTKDNPFSAKERKDMLKAALKEAKIRNYKLYPIPDINSNSRWVTHVMETVGSFDIAYSGNALVLHLFKTKHIKTARITEIQPYSSTRIRKKLAKNMPIAADVPRSVLKYLENISAQKRVAKALNKPK